MLVVAKNSKPGWLYVTSIKIITLYCHLNILCQNMIVLFLFYDGKGNAVICMIIIQNYREILMKLFIIDHFVALTNVVEH